MRAAVLLLAYFLASPANAENFYELFFDLQYTAATVGPDCGVITEAEGARLRAAIIAHNRQATALSQGGPRVPAARIREMQAKIESSATTGAACVRAWRYLPTVIDDFPPHGRRPRPYNKLQIAREAAHRRHMVDALTATVAQRCGGVTADESRELIARSASIPTVRYELRLAEISDATREGIATAHRIALPCVIAMEMLELVETRLAEDQTGWVEPD